MNKIHSMNVVSTYLYIGKIVDYNFKIDDKSVSNKLGNGITLNLVIIFLSSAWVEYKGVCKV